jgi:hypothetical protein
LSAHARTALWLLAIGCTSPQTRSPGDLGGADASLAPVPLDGALALDAMSAGVTDLASKRTDLGSADLATPGCRPWQIMSGGGCVVDPNVRWDVKAGKFLVPVKQENGSCISLTHQSPNPIDGCDPPSPEADSYLDGFMAQNNTARVLSQTMGDWGGATLVMPGVPGGIATSDLLNRFSVGVFHNPTNNSNDYVSIGSADAITETDLGGTVTKKLRWADGKDNSGWIQLTVTPWH